MFALLHVVYFMHYACKRGRFCIKSCDIFPDLVDYQTDSYYNQACLSDSAMSIYVTSGEMEIASPYYGMSQYANNMNCRWIVTAAMVSVNELLVKISKK